VAEGADALVLTTEWDEFRNLDLAELAGRMAQAILIDGRNLFDAEKAQNVGFDYAGIGHCVKVPRRVAAAKAMSATGSHEPAGVLRRHFLQ
jgi:UDPglucose 6-dehydrogenase